MPFPPITHIALTVSDLDRSAAWYSRLFDAEPVLRTVLLKETPNEYSVAVWAEPNFAVHHFADGGRERADARNPGLDHVAFGCETLTSTDGGSRSGIPTATHWSCSRRSEPARGARPDTSDRGQEARSVGLKVKVSPRPR
jgi:catechol 2,3-dioxygenase-like lactoylglutathione lyase family enzyme